MCEHCGAVAFEVEKERNAHNVSSFPSFFVYISQKEGNARERKRMEDSKAMEKMGRENGNTVTVLGKGAGTMSLAVS